MFTTLDRLEALAELGDLQVQASILESMSMVQRNYFSLVQLQKQV